MWIHKSDVAIRENLVKEARRRKSLLRPLGSAAMLTGNALILYSVGLRGCASGVVIFTNTPATFGVRFVLLGGLLFLVMFAVAICRQRRSGGLFTGDRIMMCRACTESQRAPGSMRCPCGGILEPFDNFDWVSDKDDGEQSPEGSEGR